MGKDSSNRVKVNTTISPEDKKFLEDMNISAASALSIGIQTLKNALGINGLTTNIPLANITMSSIKSRDSGDVESLANQRIASLQKIIDSTPWRSIDELADYMRKIPTSLHGMEEVHEEDDQDIP